MKTTLCVVLVGVVGGALGILRPFVEGRRPHQQQHRHVVRIYENHRHHPPAPFNFNVNRRGLAAPAPQPPSHNNPWATQRYHVKRGVGAAAGTGAVAAGGGVVEGLGNYFDPALFRAVGLGNVAPPQIRTAPPVIPHPKRYANSNVGVGGYGGGGGLVRVAPPVLSHPPPPPPPAPASPASRIFRYVSVHVPPPESEEPAPPRRIINAGGPRDTNYNIIFVRAPSPPPPPKTEVILPEMPQQKTLVYVMVKKPQEMSPEEAIKFTTPPMTRPAKPEVYFIQYKGDKNKEGAQQQQPQPVRVAKVAAPPPPPPSSFLVEDIIGGGGGGGQEEGYDGVPESHYNSGMLQYPQEDVNVSGYPSAGYSTSSDYPSASASASASATTGELGGVGMGSYPPEADYYKRRSTETEEVEAAAAQEANEK